MSIQSSTKFIAEFSLKIRRLRKQLMVASAIMPVDEVEGVLDTIRRLETEACTYESLIDSSPTVRRGLEDLLAM